MDNDLTLLHQKIDTLTQVIQNQQERLEILEGNGNGYLHNKLDYLVDQMQEYWRRQESMEELRNDLVPIVNHAVKLSINELAEIGSDFELEDLLFLLKRVLRDTHMLVDLLNRLEGTVELFDDVQEIGNQAFHQAVITLDRLEREGYFSFTQGAWRIFEKIVNEFSEEDVNALGENIVTILKTVRNLTQPEIMSLTNQALEAVRITPESEGDVTVWNLMKDLSDPKVRKGMARLLNLLKVLADQPNIQKN